MPESSHNYSGWISDRIMQVLKQRPALAAERPGSYVALPVAIGREEAFLAWEVGKPGVFGRGDQGLDRQPVEMAGNIPLRFADREAAEDLAAALTAGRCFRGLPNAVPPPQEEPKGERPWWRFWG